MVTRTLDRVLERVAIIENYLLPVNITGSEIALLLLVIGWFWWFVIFDVSEAGPAFTYTFSEMTWATIFGLVAGVHAVGIWWPVTRLRIYAASGYALIWLVWTIISGIGQISSTTCVTCFVMFLLSVFIAVRISYKFTIQTGG